MLNVSAQYKQDMKKNVRNQSYEQLVLKIFNTQAMDNAELSCAAQDAISSLYGLVDDRQLDSATYGTLELRRLLLDGSQDVIPASSPDNQGFLSAALSDANSAFSSNPVIVIDFTESFNFSGLTFEFDTPTGDYVSELELRFYSISGGVFRTVTVSPNSTQFSYLQVIDNVGSIEVECKKTSQPHRRARIRQIYLGVFKEFGNDLLSETHRENDVDPLSRRLPTESYNVSLWDFEKAYDPDNPQGYWAYIDAGAPLSQRKGYKLDTGEIEWLPYVKYILTGKPAKDGYKVLFSAEKKLSSLTDTYYKGIHSGAGVSLYALAVDVLEDAGVTLYSIDASLQSIFTTSPLPVLSHRECLQLIAHAGMCRLFTAADGTITMKHGWYPSVVQDYALDFNAQMAKPIVDITPPLYAVDVLLYGNSVESAAKQLIKTDAIINGTQTVFVDYALSTGQIATVTGGTLNSAEYYARRAALNITASGSVTIEITGLAITQATSRRAYIANHAITGESEEVDNPLVTTEEHQQALAKFRAKYLENRNAYTVTYRGNPELENNDAITLQTDFYGRATAIIIKDTLSFSGSLSGELVLKRLDNYGSDIYAGSERYAGEVIGVM